MRISSGFIVLVLVAAALPCQGRLICWLRAEGSGRDQIGGIHGRVEGNVGYAASPYGRAFLLNGQEGGIHLGDPPQLRLTGSFSIRAFVHAFGLPKEESIHAQIVFRGDDRPGTDPYFLAIEPDGNLLFAVDYAEEQRYQIVTPMPLLRWVEIVATFDARSNVLKLYLDGKLRASGVSPGPPVAVLDPGYNPGVSIGNHNRAPSNWYNMPLNGMIDEVQIYDSVVQPLGPGSYDNILPDASP